MRKRGPNFFCSSTHGTPVGPTATLYGAPGRGNYRVLESVEYGEKLTLPEPFGLEVDTGMFPVS